MGEQCPWIEAFMVILRWVALLIAQRAWEVDSWAPTYPKPLGSICKVHLAVHPGMIQTVLVHQLRQE